MLLNILQCSRQPPTTNNYPVQNTEVEKANNDAISCSNHRSLRAFQVQGTVQSALDNSTNMILPTALRGKEDYSMFY